MMDRTALAERYARTQYRVRLARGRHATIRIGAPLPAALACGLHAPDAPWCFVTAWNPRSERLSTLANRARQRELLATLRPRAATLLAGVGVADRTHWREPSVFVTGLPFDDLDQLMQPFGQHAIVRGAGTTAAELHWLD